MTACLYISKRSGSFRAAYYLFNQIAFDKSLILENFGNVLLHFAPIHIDIAMLSFDRIANPCEEIGYWIANCHDFFSSLKLLPKSVNF